MHLFLTALISHSHGWALTCVGEGLVTSLPCTQFFCWNTIMQDYTLTCPIHASVKINIKAVCIYATIKVVKVMLKSCNMIRAVPEEVVHISSHVTCLAQKLYSYIYH